MANFAQPACAFNHVSRFRVLEQALLELLELVIVEVGSCRIPDDCIDSKRYPLFMARAVLKELIESLQSTQGVKPC